MEQHAHFLCKADCCKMHCQQRQSVNNLNPISCLAIYLIVTPKVFFLSLQMTFDKRTLKGFGQDVVIIIALILNLVLVKKTIGSNLAAHGKKRTIIVCVSMLTATVSINSLIKIQLSK